MEASNDQALVGNLKTEATGMMQWANGLTVATKADADTAMLKLGEIKGIRAKWVAYWKPLKEAANTAWKGIVEKEKEGTDVVDQAERVVKSKVLAWQLEQQRIAAEEQRRLQAEADEKARKERERLEKEAARLKTPEKQAERLEQAAAVVAPTVTVQAPVASASGTSTRKVYKAVILDKSALIRAAVPGSVAESMLAFDQKAADAFARATKGASNIPGIKFVAEDVLSVRSM